jgi:hypothetical protein
VSRLEGRSAPTSKKERKRKGKSTSGATMVTPLVLCIWMNAIYLWINGRKALMEPPDVRGVAVAAGGVGTEARLWQAWVPESVKDDPGTGRNCQS